VAAERVQTLSEVVGEAGIADMAEGIDMLAKGENVKAWGAMLGMMSKQDLERGLELARVAGELATVSDVVTMLQMPVLADFLESRGTRLREAAVRVLVQFAGTRALGQAMGETGQAIQGLGEQELMEGAARVAVSDAAAQRSRELKKASEHLAQVGADKLVAAEIAGEAAKMAVEQGAVDMAEGGMKIGAGTTMEEVGEAFEERAEK
jgi:hypothetical protein